MPQDISDTQDMEGQHVQALYYKANDADDMQLPYTQIFDEKLMAVVVSQLYKT